MRKCVVAAALVCGALPVGPIAESAQAASVADFYELAKPTGEGPFPAVVLAPGCGGFHDEYSPPVFDQYRQLFVNDGFAVINVDFIPRHTASRVAPTPLDFSFHRRITPEISSLQ